MSSTDVVNGWASEEAFMIMKATPVNLGKCVVITHR